MLHGKWSTKDVCLTDTWRQTRLLRFLHEAACMHRPPRSTLKVHLRIQEHIGEGRGAINLFWQVNSKHIYLSSSAYVHSYRTISITPSLMVNLKLVCKVFFFDLVFNSPAHSSSTSVWGCERWVSGPSGMQDACTAGPRVTLGGTLALFWHIV